MLNCDSAISVACHSGLMAGQYNSVQRRIEYFIYDLHYARNSRRSDQFSRSAEQF